MIPTTQPHNTNYLMRESQIEGAACTYAKSKGWLAYKFTSPGRSGVPDRIMISDTGQMLMIEFKTPTGKLSPLQVNEHRLLRLHGVSVYTVCSVEQAKQIIDNYE